MTTAIVVKMSRLARIKIGLTSMVMNIVGLATAVVIAVIAFTGGLAIMFGNEKIINLYDSVINGITFTINDKFEAIIEKIIEEEIGDIEE